MNKKFMLEIKNEGYQAVIRLKENNKKLLEDAEGLYKLKNPEKIEGIKNKEIKEDTIYVVSTDLNMANSTMNKIIHARGDIENEGFNELKNQCNMKHCYMADENAIHVVLQIMILSYNLWELYIYGHLYNFEDMKITKFGYIERIAEAINEASYKELIIFSSA